jgi:hypothetical protein
VTREAAKETAEQLDVWATQIIPILNDLTVAEDGIERPRRTHPMERFDRQELLAAPIADLVILRKALDLLNAKPVQKLTLQACNLIEASAMRFIDGVADEQKAFMPLSSTFCHFVERTYYFYCSMRNKDDQLNRWAYTLKLYRVWSQRRIKFELDAKQQSLAEALTAATKNATPVLPIGL